MLLYSVSSYFTLSGLVVVYPLPIHCILVDKLKDECGKRTKVNLDNWPD